MHKSKASLSKGSWRAAGETDEIVRWKSNFWGKTYPSSAWFLFFYANVTTCFNFFENFVNSVETFDCKWYNGYIKGGCSTEKNF